MGMFFCTLSGMGCLELCRNYILYLFVFSQLNSRVLEGGECACVFHIYAIYEVLWI